ncbi:hypothetical protein AB2713_25750 [Citrobacter werkmanii]|uniref:hypothetical protein n=1 Tax=Citrobacter werkmanii TaxID=67827 RepID=UPI003463C690
MSDPSLLSLDSLGKSLGVPGLAPDIFPWVSWLYRDHVQLAVLFVCIGLLIGLSAIWSGRMRYVGLSRKERLEYSDRYRRDNQRPPPFSMVASLDSPGRWITARRHLWHGLNMLIEWGGVALLVVLVLAVMAESWGESIIRPDYYAAAEVFFCCTPDDRFRDCLVFRGAGGRVRAGWTPGFFPAGGRFAIADQKVNAKLNQESRRSSQRTRRNDRRAQPALRGPGASCQCARGAFPLSRRRKQQVVFLGKKEDGLPVLVSAPIRRAEDQCRKFSACPGVARA